MEELKSNLEETVSHHFTDELDEMTQEKKINESQRLVLDTLSFEQKFDFLGWGIEERDSIFKELKGDKLFALLELSSLYKEKNSNWTYSELENFIRLNYYSFLHYLENDKSLVDPLEWCESWWVDSEKSDIKG